jgi:hypothetical protein
VGVISNYGELKTAVQTYAKRSTSAFTENLPTFVMRAHVTLLRDLDIPLLHQTADLAINAERVSPPADFRAVVRLMIDSDWDNPLSPTSIELRLRESVKYTSGRPRVFAVEGDKLAFGPVPDTTYTGKLLYKRAIDFFASDLATNALLTRYPFAYLYGALAEAYGFDKFDEDQAKYEALFRSEIASINAAEQANAMGGGVLQPGSAGAIV